MKDVYITYDGDKRKMGTQYQDTLQAIQSGEFKLGEPGSEGDRAQKILYPLQPSPTKDRGTPLPWQVGYQSPIAQSRKTRSQPSGLEVKVEEAPIDPSQDQLAVALEPAVPQDRDEALSILREYGLSGSAVNSVYANICAIRKERKSGSC